MNSPSSLRPTNTTEIWWKNLVPVGKFSCVHITYLFVDDKSQSWNNKNNLASYFRQVLEFRHFLAFWLVTWEQISNLIIRNVFSLHLMKDLISQVSAQKVFQRTAKKLEVEKMNLTEKALLCFEIKSMKLFLFFVLFCTIKKSIGIKINHRNAFESD